MNHRSALVVLNQVKGGLGNQLFQHVFARSLAKRLHAELVTDDSAFTSDPYGRRSSIAELQPGMRSGSLAEFQGPGAYLLQDGILQSLQDALVLPNDARVLVLSGYWQNEKLLDPEVAHATHTQLCARAEPLVPANLAARIRACANAVAVHVRRRDYAHMGLCTEAYYCAAVEQIHQLHPGAELFVFSDEPNVVRHWMDLRGLNFHMVTSGNDLGDLYLMALCTHFVIANSSYSWWAAYWGESRGGLVFCPREWVTIGTLASPCPARWIQVADAVRPLVLDAADISRQAGQIRGLLQARQRPAPDANHHANQIDLPVFFAGMPDHVVIKLPAHFPDYREHEDIDIVCRDAAAVQAHILQAGQPYIARGFRFEEHRANGHLHVDVYPPGATRLDFRFDLLADFAGYRKFVVDPSYHAVVLDSKRQVLHNGTPVFVPALPHELVLRCLEYLEWKDEIPAKKKHLDYLMAHQGTEFLPLVSRYTNLVLPGSTPAPGAEEPPAQPQSRMDYLLIWGHGLAHTREILDMVRGQADLEIVTIVRRDIPDVGQLVQDVYACDTVPFQHLVAKTRYLLTTPPHVLFILLKNHRPQETYFGDGAFRHIQSRLIKDLKEAVRDRFNPRTPLGARSEDHVIHASDYPSQVAHVLSVLGLPPLAHYEREAHPEIDAPYHLGTLGRIEVQELPLDALFASILGRGLVPVRETPHYQYATGNQAPYQNYHAQHFGRALTDDHLPEAFDALIRDFRYGDRLPNGKRNLIVARPLGDGRYQLLDGVHRAAILASRGVQSVQVGVVAGDADGASG
jgi:hypothetical protein